MDSRPLEPIPDIRPNGFTHPPAGHGLSRYSGQELTWRPCPAPFQCATVLAPLDYGAPDGTALTLAVAKRPATKTPRLGTLFINPGGPGGSGLEYLLYFDRTDLENYDIVGWDPRGVRASTPVQCYGNRDLDRYFAVDVSPDTDAEQTTYLQESRTFGQSCLSRSGRLLQHISTTETVRDLDLLRGLVGDDKINYFGSSYGTRIGSLYAQLFPQRVGRMVLDGAVDITGKSPVSQIEGFERALDHFATWCAGKRCQLGDSRQQVLTAVHGYLDRLDQSPAKVPNGRILSQQQGVQAVLTAMYGGTGGLAGTAHRPGERDPEERRPEAAGTRGRGQSAVLQRSVRPAGLLVPRHPLPGQPGRQRPGRREGGGRRTSGRRPSSAGWPVPMSPARCGRSPPRPSRRTSPRRGPRRSW